MPSGVSTGASQSCGWKPGGDVGSNVGRPDLLVETQQDHHRRSSATAAAIPVRVQETDGRSGEAEPYARARAGRPLTAVAPGLMVTSYLVA